jgi:CheY-like chemotaxis protein
MMREDLFDELESVGIDIGIAKPIIPSVLYNGIIEILKIKPPEEKRQQKQDQLIAPHPYRLLLVEDNKTNQFIAKSILEQAGFVMVLTSDGEEGYQYFAAHQNEIDLILMDLHMPVMDGYTSSDLIGKISQDIPIVAMTADAIAGVEEKCRSHGIWNYVSKPFEPDQLIETLISLLSGKEPKAQLKRAEAFKSTAVDTAHAVDFEDGIKRMGGDKAIYRLVLQSFAGENYGVEEQLRSAIQLRNFTQGEQIVHKIKSSAGSIGAKNLHDVAAELQLAFKEENEAAIMELTAEFDECLTRTLLEIKKFGELNA